MLLEVNGLELILGLGLRGEGLLVSAWLHPL